MLYFGFNFICFYYAVQYISSEAVIFSMAVISTRQCQTIFAHHCCIIWSVWDHRLFWHDVMGTTLNSNTLMGIGLCILGTYGFLWAI